MGSVDGHPWAPLQDLSEAQGCGTVGVNLGQATLLSHVFSTVTSFPRPHPHLMPTTIGSTGPSPIQKNSHDVCSQRRSQSSEMYLKTTVSVMN